MNMLRAEAIQALVPGANFSTTEDNIFIWESDKPQPSEEEINAKIKELELLLPMRVLREQRDRLLKETDVYMVVDHTTKKLKEWKTYRQNLRDLTSTASPKLDENGQLIDVTWPTKPE